LNNVAKYANATTAHVRLAHTNGAIEFRVTDDGAGFDPDVTGHGTGLRGMADRLEAVGGALAIASTPGQGTTVSGRIPVEPTS
jgi:signal transduction histidine kinase